MTCVVCGEEIKDRVYKTCSGACGAELKRREVIEKWTNGKNRGNTNTKKSLREYQRGLNHVVNWNVYK